jgi:cobaltochelatase CobS
MKVEELRERLAAARKAAGIETDEPVTETKEEVKAEPPKPWFPKGKIVRKSKDSVLLSAILGRSATKEYKFKTFDCPPNLAHLIPAIDPNFVPDEQYTLALCQAIDTGSTLSAYGPPGTGKTEHVAQVCAHLGRPYLFMSGMGGTDPSDYVGMAILNDGNIEWSDGDLAFAVRNGCVVLFDEPFKCSAQTLMCIQSLTDGRRTLKLNGHPIQSEVTLKAHPEFRIILADNVRGVGDEMGRYAAEVQDQSTLNRSTFKMNVQYPESGIEVDILQRRHPDADPMFLKRVVQLAGTIRKGWEEHSFDMPFSLRDTNNFVMVAMLDGSAASGFRKTYYEAASDQEKSELRKLWELVDFNGESL